MKNTTPINMPSRGSYTLSKVDASGNPRTEGCPSNSTENVVTYGGAFKSLFNDGLFSYLYAEIGTSSTERVRSDTALGTPDSGRTSRSNSVGRAGNEVDNLDGTTTITLTRTMSFPLGGKVGTFSEVGVYSTSSGDTFIAGQLIKDEFGAPTTVTILSDEQLIITYTLEWVLPNNSSKISTGTLTDASSNSYSYELWAQPYFREYASGGTGSTTVFPGYGNVGFLAANGTTQLLTETNNASGAFSSSLGIAGEVTATSTLYSYGPAAGDISPISFIMPGIYGDPANIIDTVDVLRESNPDGSQSAVILKLLDPITKTDQQSLSFQFELTVQI